MLQGVKGPREDTLVRIEVMQYNLQEVLIRSQGVQDSDDFIDRISEFEERLS